MKKKIPNRKEFKYFNIFETRWDDNDIYGHLNNNVHFRMFDTTINGFLLKNNLLSIKNSKNIYLVVKTSCTYFEQISYPERVDVGIRISKLGNSSLIYKIGIFRKNSYFASASGKFVHVNVLKRDCKPISIDLKSREKFMKIM